MPVIADNYQLAIVYQFKLYDITFDEFKVSTRLTTRDAIHQLNGVQIGPPYEVPSEDVDMDGLTIKGYVLAIDR